MTEGQRSAAEVRVGTQLQQETKSLAFQLSCTEPPVDLTLHLSLSCQRHPEIPEVLHQRQGPPPTNPERAKQFYSTKTKVLALFLSCLVNHYCHYCIIEMHSFSHCHLHLLKPLYSLFSFNQILLGAPQVRLMPLQGGSGST